MKYISTRGGVPSVTFQEALLTGLAGDGGLYMPQYIPTVTKEQLQSWAGLKYPQLAEKVLRLFISENEIPTPDLTDIIKDCFASFHHPDILPINQIGSYNILEMWHGPTGAFKDLAFAIVACFVNYFLNKQGKRGIALIGTLGDTGCSALQAFKNMKNVSVICLYPRHSISKLQRLQTTTVNTPNILVYSCDSDSDDFDSVIMKVFDDKEFSKKYNIFWINSINVGRIICHTVHHVFMYLQMSPTCNREITAYIPSGALADSSSAYLTHCMGLPIKITSVVNENDFLYNCLTKKAFIRPQKVVRTYSCAMDTVFPHNIERVLFMLSKGDTAAIKSIMDDYYTKGVAILPQPLLDTAQGSISCQRVTQEESLATAKYVWDNYQYALCPHTSLAVTALRRFQNGDCSFSVCYATATAAKFLEFLTYLKIPVPAHPSTDGLEAMKEVYEEMNEGANWEDILRKGIVRMYEQ